MKLITIATSFLLLCIPAIAVLFPFDTWDWALGATLLLLPLVEVITYMLSPRSIEVTADLIIIHKVVGKTVLRRADIADIHPHQTRSTFEARTFGSGGLFGFFGKFYNTRYGHYTAYVGDFSKSFYVILKNGGKYLLSCADRDAMLKALQPTV